MGETVSVVVAVVAFLFGIGMYFRADRHDGEAVEKVARNVHITNAILGSWAIYSVEEKIEGLPVRVELDWTNGQLNWLQGAAVVIKHGFNEARYKLVMDEQLDRSGRGGWAVRGAFSFELDTDYDFS